MLPLPSMLMSLIHPPHRYVCEIAPPTKRGRLATIVQVFVTIGICLGYFMCYGTVRVSSSLSWRLPLAFQSGIALFLAVASSFYLPQSPRWLAYKGRREEASLAWDKLGVSSAEREKDLLQNPTATVEAVTRPTEAVKLGFIEKIRRDVVASISIFRGDSRKPMILGVFLMSMQQLSGIDGVLYVSLLHFLGSMSPSTSNSGSTRLCSSNKLVSPRPKPHFSRLASPQSLFAYSRY